MKLPGCTCKPVHTTKRRRRRLLVAALTVLLFATLATAQEQRFKCQPIGLCEPCASTVSSNPACLPYGNRQPLLCTATRDLPAHLEAPDLPHSSPLPISSAEAHERAESDSGRIVKRDLFWEADGVPHRDALQKMREIAWEGMRIKEAQAQAVSLQGQTFTSWAACGKVVQKEVNDFGEFVLCNLVFAALATGIVFFRYRILASRQYLKLAARIGIPNLV